MGHSNVRIKVRRRKVANLAAMSKKYSVKYCTIPTSDKELYQVPWDTITNKLSRFNVGGNMAGKYYLKDKKGNLTRLDYSWEYEKHPQVKRIIKCEKHKYSNPNKKGSESKTIKSLARNDFVSMFKNYPYELPKMTQAQYAEKLIEHKIAKWERNNPRPIKSDDLQDDIFSIEYMIPWNAERDRAIERIHDFVLSLYDKLPLTGRFKTGEHKYTETLVAELKDHAGEGHRVNELKPESVLMKKAQKITNEIHAKNNRLIATNLRDHKRQRGRIILPKAA